jgi:hypothetical protein
MRNQHCLPQIGAHQRLLYGSLTQCIQRTTMKKGAIPLHVMPRSVLPVIVTVRTYWFAATFTLYGLHSSRTNNLRLTSALKQKIDLHRIRSPLRWCQMFPPNALEISGACKRVNRRRNRNDRFTTQECVAARHDLYEQFNTNRTQVASPKRFAVTSSLQFRNA